MRRAALDKRRILRRSQGMTLVKKRQNPKGYLGFGLIRLILARRGRNH